MTELRTEPQPLHLGGPGWAEVTEVAGTQVTAEQISRVAQRYGWAAERCRDRDVVEVACGSGQGLAALEAVARTVVASDLDADLATKAARAAGGRVPVVVGSADSIASPSESVDVVILFEAIYYLPDPSDFFREARRVLRPGGDLLICSANPSLWDFVSSPKSNRYFGVTALGEELRRFGFDPRFFGGFPVGKVSARQRLLRPAKAAASRLGLVPNTMAAKRLLKRMVFGELVEMPTDVDPNKMRWDPPTQIRPTTDDREHKVIFCAARKAARS